jgi:mortality factor 4-like protein 1
VTTRRSKNAAPEWSVPGSSEWDVKKVLMDDEMLAPDHMLRLPPSDNYSYIYNGQLKSRDFYNQFAAKKTPVSKVERHHPKLQQHIVNKTDTAAVWRYYNGMSPDTVLPIAGIIFDEQPPRPWRIKVSSSEELQPEPGDARKSSKSAKAAKAAKAASESSSSGSSLTPPPPSLELEGSNELESSAPRMPLFPNLPKRTGRTIFEKEFDYKKIQDAEEASNNNQEDQFHARPSIQLHIPDHVKAILVDDWENVTKNQQLVPLPSAHPVSQILDDYSAYEAARRVPGSPNADILEEVVGGLREYFEKCLGRVLLYRYDYNQLSFK